MEILCVSVMLMLLNFKVTSGHYAHSPCPDVFDYRSDGGGIYGIINLRPSAPANVIVVRLNYTIATRLSNNYVGRIQPIGDSLHLLQEYNRGIPIQYRVEFPVSSPLPRLTALTVNDDALCYGSGDVPGPNQYVTTASLQHTLFLKGQGGGIYNQFDNQPHNKPQTGWSNDNRPSKPNVDQLLEYFGESPNDGQIYTFGDNDDRTGSWNSNDRWPNQQDNRYETNTARPGIYNQYDRPKPGTGWNSNNQYNSQQNRPDTGWNNNNQHNQQQSRPDTGWNYNNNQYNSPQNRPQTGWNQNTQYERPPHKPETGWDNYNRPSRPQGDRVDFGESPNDVQIYTFGDNDRRTGSWNSFNNKPEAPRPTRPQTPQYYPEEQPATQAPPPTRPPATYPPPPPPPQPAAAIQCGVIAGGNERQPLIYKGQSYSRGEWPWLAALYKRKDGSLSFICSGTLVSDRHVITAAHCMRDKNTISSTRDIVVKVGVYNLEDWGDDITETRTLATATIHESFNSTTLANDILILTFERSVEFNANIRPACLWTGNPDLSQIVGASGVVAGWGRSEAGPAGRGEPRVVRMPVVSTAVCRGSRPDFHKLTSENTLCAGDRNDAGPCLGDSGGGLYIIERGRWQLRGIVSLSLRPESGDTTCNLREYIVFTDSAKYVSWINNVIRST